MKKFLTIMLTTAAIAGATVANAANYPTPYDGYAEWAENAFIGNE